MEIKLGPLRNLKIWQKRKVRILSFIKFLPNFLVKHINLYFYFKLPDRPQSRSRTGHQSSRSVSPVIRRPSPSNNDPLSSTLQSNNQKMSEYDNTQLALPNIEKVEISPTKILEDIKLKTLKPSDSIEDLNSLKFNKPIKNLPIKVLFSNINFVL